MGPYPMSAISVSVCVPVGASRPRHSGGFHHCPAYRCAVDGVAVGVVTGRATSPRYYLLGGSSVCYRVWARYRARPNRGYIYDFSLSPLIPLALAKRDRVLKSTRTRVVYMYLYIYFYHTILIISR